MADEPARDCACVVAVLPHADRERLDAAQDEPAIERAGYGTERLLQEVQALRNRRIVGRREAADDVRMTSQILRRRVDDEVGAELQRALQVGRGERVVDGEDRACCMRGVGSGADVDDIEHRV